ncbi:hypothetical protein CK911_06160 [Aeromonas sp. CU5]|nr:hypothetical protein CK911_06160 [Aeromonas sp. CU5]
MIIQQRALISALYIPGLGRQPQGQRRPAITFHLQHNCAHHVGARHDAIAQFPVLAWGLQRLFTVAGPQLHQATRLIETTKRSLCHDRWMSSPVTDT